MTVAAPCVGFLTSTPARSVFSPTTAETAISSAYSDSDSEGTGSGSTREGYSTRIRKALTPSRAEALAIRGANLGASAHSASDQDQHPSADPSRTRHDAHVTRDRFSLGRIAARQPVLTATRGRRVWGVPIPDHIAHESQCDGDPGLAVAELQAQRQVSKRNQWRRLDAAVCCPVAPAGLGHVLVL